MRYVSSNELESDDSYSEIIYYLTNLSSPPYLVDLKGRELSLKAMKYCLNEDDHGWKNLDGVILRCANKQETKKLILEFHVGFCGGHFFARTIAHKNLRVRYYWPIIFTDTQIFQILSGLSILH